MRILLVGINYAPDLIGVAKYNTELCQSLVAEGHEVRVITAPPYYPAWKKLARFNNSYFKAREIEKVRVLRTPIYVPGHPSGAKRLIHHASFALTSAIPVMMEGLSWRPDIILSIAPSLMSAAWVSFVARRVGAKSWLHVQDFEVDAAFDLGLLRGDLLRRLMLKAEATILKSFDRVSTISSEMLLRLQRKGVARENTVEIRNWIDTGAIVPSSRTTRYRKELKLAESDIVALYSGTMSTKQGLDLVIEAAIQLEASHPHLYFILAGDGPHKARLKEMAAGHSNVFFLGLQPNETFNELMATADFHLIPQRTEAADLVLPSKLGAIFSSARPVIAMAGEGTGLATEVSGAGVVVPPGDPQALAAAIRLLSQDAALCRQLGTQGRKRAIERWDRGTIVHHWANAMSATHTDAADAVRSATAAEEVALPLEDVAR